MHTTDTLMQRMLGNAFNDSSDNAVALLRRHLLTSYNHPLSDEGLWLIGTDGCHLCDNAQALYDLARRANPLPELILLELLDFEDEVQQVFAHHIPVLISTKKMLVHPFGLMDIVSLR